MAAVFDAPEEQAAAATLIASAAGRKAVRVMVVRHTGTRAPRRCAGIPGSPRKCIAGAARRRSLSSLHTYRDHRDRRHRPELACTRRSPRSREGTPLRACIGYRCTCPRGRTSRAGYGRARDRGAGGRRPAARLPAPECLERRRRRRGDRHRRRRLDHHPRRRRPSRHRRCTQRRLPRERGEGDGRCWTSGAAVALQAPLQSTLATARASRSAIFPHPSAGDLTRKGGRTSSPGPDPWWVAWETSSGHLCLGPGQETKTYPRRRLPRSATGLAPRPPSACFRSASLPRSSRPSWGAATRRRCTRTDAGKRGHQGPSLSRGWVRRPR